MMMSFDLSSSFPCFCSFAAVSVSLSDEET